MKIIFVIYYVSKKVVFDIELEVIFLNNIVWIVWLVLKYDWCKYVF